VNSLDANRGFKSVKTGCLYDSWVVPPIHSTNPLVGFPDVPADFSLDFEKVRGVIRAEIPAKIDGKQAILQMREEDSRQWRQMEWIGFWFEHFVKQKVLPSVGSEQGPKFGNTTIDLMLSSPWDLKAHLSESTVVILNDVEAVGECIQDLLRYRNQVL